MQLLSYQETPGLLCFKQMPKQKSGKWVGKPEAKEDKTNEFAAILSRALPFHQEEIYDGLVELEFYKVIRIDGDTLSHPGMVRSGKISQIRSEIGRKGGCKTSFPAGKSGVLFWITNGANAHRISVSVNPKNRLYRWRCDRKDADLFIKKKVEVADMAAAYASYMEVFAEAIQANSAGGDWLDMGTEQVEELFALLQANAQAIASGKNGQAKTEQTSESIYIGIKDTTTTNLVRVCNEPVGKDSDVGRGEGETKKAEEGEGVRLSGAVAPSVPKIAPATPNEPPIAPAIDPVEAISSSKKREVHCAHGERALREAGVLFTEHFWSELPNQTPADLPALLEGFNSHLMLEPKVHVRFSDYLSHFRNKVFSDRDKAKQKAKKVANEKRANAQYSEPKGKALAEMYANKWKDTDGSSK